jgi:hypothetical protein
MRNAVLKQIDKAYPHLSEYERALLKSILNANITFTGRFPF